MSQATPAGPPASRRRIDDEEEEVDNAGGLVDVVASLILSCLSLV